MNKRLATVIAVAVGISGILPAAAEEVGVRVGPVGATVGSAPEREHKTVIIKKDREPDRDRSKTVIIKKDRDHDRDRGGVVIDHD